MSDGHPQDGAMMREPEAAYVVGKVRDGLSMVEFQFMRDLYAMSEERFGALLGMSRATLHRRKKAGKLDRAESDRLVRYARLFNRAAEILGGDAPAQRWLCSPAFAFGGEWPVDFADTEIGAREVEALLGRIGHGVFS